MKVFEVDLYEYFKIDKQDGCVGKLIAYVQEKNAEINAKRRKPAMLVLPGGGYGYTSFREDEPIAAKYFSYGFCSFVLRYSVAPIRYPYALAEAVMAMNYIRLNAEELGINPDMVAAVGFSAGGHLCETLGSLYDCDDVKKIFTPAVSARPNAIVLGYPVSTCPSDENDKKTHFASFDNLCGDDRELRLRLSARNFVNSKSSPAFIWATCNDGVVPIRNSLDIAYACEMADIPFSLHIYGIGQHGLSLADKTVYGYDLPPMTESVRGWVELSIEWLKEQGIFIKD